MKIRPLLYSKKRVENFKTIFFILFLPWLFGGMGEGKRGRLEFRPASYVPKLEA